MKKVLCSLLVVLLITVPIFGLSEVDISTMSVEELIELQASVNTMLKEKTSYTLLPGIYNCANDFSFKWYNCIVLPGPDGEERTAIIEFYKSSPYDTPFLTYEISSSDDGIKLSLFDESSGRTLFMIIKGAALEAVPFAGM